MSIYIAYYILITISFICLYQGLLYYGDKGLHRSRAVQWKSKDLFLLIIACGLLVLILGLRSGNKGVDLYNAAGTGYFFYYERINNDSLLEIFENFSKKKYANFEIGFVLFCKFLGTICHNQQILLIGCAFMAIVPVGYFIYKYSQNIWLSILIYIAMPFFSSASFSALRQGISIALIMLSFGFVKEKRKLAFLITVIIACSFHSSAIVTLVAYPAYYFPISRKRAIYGGSVALIIIFALKERLFYLLAWIVDESPEIYKSNAINLFLIMVFLYIIILAFTNDDDTESRGFANILWLACAAQAFGGINNLAGRITWYFMAVLIVLLPNCLVNMRIRQTELKKGIIFVTGILACAIGLYWLRTNHVAMSYPYEFYWFEG